MTVGCLGDFEFSVSSDFAKTFSDLSFGSSARYATHARHKSTSLVEFTGTDPAEISFDVYLDKNLGVTDVTGEMEKLKRITEKAEVRPLVIGNKSYGTYRWVVTNYRFVPKSYGGNGVVTSAKVSLTLKEYLRR